MVTRKQLCEYILRVHCSRECKMDPQNLDFTKIPETDVFKSSTVGVCMEELGLLHDSSIKEYMSSRGGIALCSFDEKGEPAVISFREILDSLKE